MLLRLFATACLAGTTFANKTFPTTSRCQQVCPSCTTNPPWNASAGNPPCNCGDSCWPGHNGSDTSDRTCSCFMQLGFCKPGEVPKWEPGAECPQCWPKENTVCACFAAIGFCDPPEILPTISQCTSHIDGWNQSPLCPGCDSIDCKCDACWPGLDVKHTPDHTCECFAELSFCEAGKQPVYTPGAKCPSCWPKENKACDCFAALEFCEARAPAKPSPDIALKETWWKSTWFVVVAVVAAVGWVASCRNLWRLVGGVLAVRARKAKPHSVSAMADNLLDNTSS